MRLVRSFAKLFLVGMLCLTSLSSARTQDRDSIVRFAPVDSVSAVWTDHVSVTLEPLAKSLSTWLDLYEHELSAAKLEGDDDLREVIERHQRLLDELRRIQQGLEAPVLDGPLIVYESPSGSKVIVARVGADRETLNEFLSAIETLAVELAGPTWQDAIASEERWRLVDGWWLWSDSSETLQALEARVMAQMTIESLEESREFQTVRAHVPRGLPGSWRFHLSQAAITPTLMTLWRKADHNRELGDDEFRQIVWEASAMDDLRALGGQWTFQQDDRWSDAAPLASLEAFALQQIPLRGIAATLEHGNGFRLEEVATQAPRISVYMQLLVNGPTFGREAVASARRWGLPIALQRRTFDDDQLFTMLLRSMSIGWSSELTPALDSLCYGLPESEKNPEDTGFYAHTAIRFRNAHTLLDEIKRLALKNDASGWRENLSVDELNLEHLDLLTDNNGSYLQYSDRYIESKRVEWMRDVEQGYEGRLLQYKIAGFIERTQQQTGATPTQTQIDDYVKTSKQQALERSANGFEVLAPRLRDRFPFDHDWIGLLPVKFSFEVPNDERRATNQLIELQKEIDRLVTALPMQSQPVVLITNWNANPHRLTDLVAMRNERVSPVADPNLRREDRDTDSTTSSHLLPETLRDWDRLIRGEFTENPVQWVCNNSVLLLGVKENGWEVRMAIGIRPPSGNIASAETEAHEDR